MKTLKLDRILGAIAIITLVIGWVVGANLAQGDVYPALKAALPVADHFSKLDDNTYAAMGDASEGSLIGYVRLATANGYGGPMQVAVAVDSQGIILGISVAEHKETPSWFRRVSDSGFIESFVSKSYQDGFQLGRDLDAITGATYTTRALAEAALSASRGVARDQLGFQVPAEAAPAVQFGIPEITIIALYAIGYFGHQSRFKFTKQARWASMILGMLVLGFIYTIPLTLADVNKFLLGFWPAWQTHLYWYLLLGGIFFVFTVDNKNPYCEWFCPFGAAQECMGLIGGAKARPVPHFKGLLLWVQRGLAWLAILLALLLRNPGLTSYEVFGTLFDLKGSSISFVLLGIILVASLFIRRPWCNYLCPLRPVTDLYRMSRRWVIDSWNQLKRKPAISAK